MKIIIERADSKDVQKFFHTIREANGHDCWGKTEWTSRYGVYIDGIFEEIYKPNEKYLAHNGEKVIYSGYIDRLHDKVSDYLDASLKEKRKKERYKTYLELQKEFSKDSEENLRIKRDVNIDEII